MPRGPNGLWKDLTTGLMYATCALLLADHAAGFPGYRSHDSVEFGTWRCNIAALAIVSCDRCGMLPAHHFITKMTGSFCGALSAFGSTTDDSVRLSQVFLFSQDRSIKRRSSIYFLRVRSAAAHSTVLGGATRCCGPTPRWGRGRQSRQREQRASETARDSQK